MLTNVAGTIRGGFTERSCRWATARVLALLIVAASTLGACDDETGRVRELGPLVVVIENKGSDPGRPLLVVKFHSQLDNYASAENLLTEPLEMGQSKTFLRVKHRYRHLTVIRKQLSLPQSDLVALTTPDKIALFAGRRVIWVFDESFRIFDAVPSTDGGVADSGVMDTHSRPDGLADGASTDGASTDGASLDISVGDASDDALKADASPTDAPSSDAAPLSDGPLPDAPSLDAT